MARAIASLSFRSSTDDSRNEARRMKRRRQRTRLQRRRLAAGQNEVDLVVPANLLLDAEPAIEVDEVGAAAEQHVLAVVDHLAGAGQFVRRCAAAEIGTALEELDVIARFGQSASGGETGKTAANDGHRLTLLSCLLVALMRVAQNPFAITVSFSAVLRRTRSEKTS